MQIQLHIFKLLTVSDLKETRMVSKSWQVAATEALVSVSFLHLRVDGISFRILNFLENHSQLESVLPKSVKLNFVDFIESRVNPDEFIEKVMWLFRQAGHLFKSIEVRNYTSNPVWTKLPTSSTTLCKKILELRINAKRLKLVMDTPHQLLPTGKVFESVVEKELVISNSHELDFRRRNFKYDVAKSFMVATPNLEVLILDSKNYLNCLVGFIAELLESEGYWKMLKTLRCKRRRRQGNLVVKVTPLVRKSLMSYILPNAGI